jgi:hypothetical protein
MGNGTPLLCSNAPLLEPSALSSRTGRPIPKVLSRRTSAAPFFAEPALFLKPDRLSADRMSPNDVIDEIESFLANTDGAGADRGSSSNPESSSSSRPSP